MTAFLVCYSRGWPVVVFDSRGSMRGIPCGFVVFPDGVAWTDDGVLAVDYASHHTHHHLFGTVTVRGETISCDGHTFSDAPLENFEFVRAWNSLGLTAGEWRLLHMTQEAMLTSERASFKP